MFLDVLSVVVTVVDGGRALRRCLTGLSSQTGAPLMEILVPYDDTVASVAAQAAEFPFVHFLALGQLTTQRSASRASGQHELIDRRRAAGLAAARGEIVAIVEDRGVPRANWAATIARLHTELPNGVIGGAVENGCDRLLNWAVYFCDFGRYQLPFKLGPRMYVTDVNVSYKRRALEQTRAIWQDRYHEPLVHWALERAGETLMLAPDLVVDQIRENLTLVSLVKERLAWGRLFGSLRVRDASMARRLALACIAPLVPGVLIARFLIAQVTKRAPLGRVVRVGPAALLLLVAWAAGEAVGCLTGKA